MQPLVSILINNYNYASFLADAIESALNQDYENIEVVVVDDGSTDQSRDVILHYHDRISYVFQENGGQSAAINRGFESCRGDIICLLDADDYYQPHKVSNIVALFTDDPDLDWCFHLTRLSHDMASVPPKADHYVSQIWDHRDDLLVGKTLPFCPCTTSSLCFSRSLYQQIHPIPDVIKITSDNYLKLAASILGRGFLLSQYLSVQKIHGQNAYTLRDDKPLLKADVMIWIAYGLRLNFPHLPKLSNNLLAIGLSLHWCAASLGPQYILHRYAQLVSLGTMYRILMMASYFMLRTSIERVFLVLSKINQPLIFQKFRYILLEKFSS